MWKHIRKYRVHQMGKVKERYGEWIQSDVSTSKHFQFRSMHFHLSLCIFCLPNICKYFQSIHTHTHRSTQSLSHSRDINFQETKCFYIMNEEQVLHFKHEKWNIRFHVFISQPNFLRFHHLTKSCVCYLYGIRVWDVCLLQR